MRSRSALILGAGMAALSLATSAVQAQPRSPDGPEGYGWGPGMMMGPGMMGGRGFGFMCNPRAAGLAEWRMDRIEQAVRPMEGQKAALAELRTASTKAAEMIAATCTSDLPSKSTDRLDLMQRRVEAMLQAIKTVRPAFEGLYAQLDNDQKTRLDAVGPRQWGWRGWRWRWNY